MNLATWGWKVRCPGNRRFAKTKARRSSRRTGLDVLMMLVASMLMRSFLRSLPGTSTMSRSFAVIFILFSVLFCLSDSTSGAVEYIITDLGFGHGRDINELGQVVGSQPSFYWTGGKRTDLPLPPYGGAFGINDSSVVVTKIKVVGDEFHAIKWRDGVVLNVLGTLGGVSSSQANAINNVGQVVGSSGTSTGLTRAFLSDGKSMINLGVLPGNLASAAADINELGQIVGTSTGLGPSRGFIYSNGTMSDIGSLGGGSTIPYAINESGHVVGRSSNGTGLSAFFYDGNSMADLGITPATSSVAEGINDLDQVVGYRVSGGPLAFLWDSQNGTRLLNNLIDPLSGWKNLETASDINNKGQIVGWGKLMNNAEHAFLLTPLNLIPEPGSVAILMICSLLTVIQRYSLGRRLNRQ